jgi:hypothetical protein
LQLRSPHEAYDVIELRDPYDELVKALRLPSQKIQCKIIGFYEMTIEEIALRCQMSLDQGALAKQRVKRA